MTIILDNDGEKLAVNEHFDIAVPIHIEEFNGETRLYVYPFAQSFAKRFIEQPVDLLSCDIENTVKDFCGDFCKKYGYTPDAHSCCRGTNFVLTGLTENAAPHESVKRIRRDGKYKNLTTFDIGSCLAAERVIYAVVKDDCIVSVAVTCEKVSEIGEYTEIGVETAVNYRNCGYAAEAVAALSEFLLSKGINVLYKCRKENLASNAVAKNVGFYDAGKFFYYVLRKTERQ